MSMSSNRPRDADPLAPHRRWLLGLAIAISDGGGRKSAALNPIMGADKVARFFIGVAKKNAGHGIRIEPAMINGTVGAIVYVDGELDHSFSMAIDRDRIAAVYIVRNPDKLRHIPASAPH
jgi:RNA polymerase sigma-70 factor, ECF subfamily